MAKFITQQRRGTKDRWVESGQLPRDGELVIEKSDDGRKRLKIGDGVTPFADLPYITQVMEDDVRALTATVQAVTAIAEEAELGSVESEVIAARTVYSGTTHDSLAGAMMDVSKDVYDLKTSLKQFMNADAVDGLQYEDNMLQLTASGKPVGEPVKVVGGGGGGGTSVNVVSMRMTNLNDSRDITTTYGKDILIAFNIYSIEDGNPTGDIKLAVKVNGSTKHTRTIAQGDYEINIKDYVDSGESNVTLTCTDIYENSKSIGYTVNVIDLNLYSTFDSSNVYSTDIDFRYYVSGAVDKVVYFEFLNNSTGVYDRHTSRSLTAASAGNEITQKITIDTPAKLSHGVHRLKVYAVAQLTDGGSVSSNELYYDIMIVREGENTPMISSVYTVTEIEEGELVSIPYIIYDPRNVICSVDLIVSSTDDITTTEYSTTTVEVGRTQQYWDTRYYPATPRDQDGKYTGSTIFTIKYNYGTKDNPLSISAVHKIKVKPSSVQVEPETDHALFLTAKGRQNSEPESVRTKWVSETDELKVETQFNNFNWVTNGWVKDDNGDTCLRVSGGAQAIINYQPFSYDVATKQGNLDLNTHGLTFEIEYAIRHVNNRDTVVFNCSQEFTTNATIDVPVYDEMGNQEIDENGNPVFTQENKTFVNNVGVRATADRATVCSTLSTVAVNYKDEEKIKLTFTIDKKGKITVNDGNGVTREVDSPRFLSLYLDGVLSSVVAYTNADNFNHNQNIVIGDTEAGCTVDIYSIRIYRTTLTPKQVVNNYIADISDIAHKKVMYNENDVYKNNKIDFDSITNLIPTIIFTGKMPTYKGDKKVVKMDFINPLNDHKRDFSKVYGGPINVEIDVQGTSSQYYARKNWKVKLNVPKKGIINNPYQHMDDEIPASVFCIKVDYAEATGTHNTQNANFAETLYYTNETDAEASVLSRLNGDILPAQKKDKRVRTTVTGFPCVIFERETESSPLVFSSKGNFNFDKDAEEAFGFTKDYIVECWEFCNNTSPVCKFLGNLTEGGYFLDDFEPRYTPFDFDKLEELEEKQEDADNDKGTITDEEKEQLVTLRTQMLSRFKAMHDWVVSTRNDIQKFRNEFTQYFDLHYTLIYYIYTFVTLMVDQRAKNMFLTYWGSKDINGVEQPGKWYPYLYDNDTSFGINNTGHLTFDYYHEDIDQIAGGTNVYNGQDSTLWVNFREAFASEIKEMYAQLRSDGKLTYDGIVNQFITQGSSRWSASVYNEDAEYKYLTMARPENKESLPNGLTNTGNLYQVKGDGEQQLKYFLQNRIMYCDSKWDAGDYPANLFSLRVNTPEPTRYITDIEDSKIHTLKKHGVYTMGIKPTSATPTVEDDTEYYIPIINIDYNDENGAVVLSETVKFTTDKEYQLYNFKAPKDATYTFSISEGYTLYETRHDGTDASRRVSDSLQVVPANHHITITPFSNMYAGVEYGANATLEQIRVEKNKEYVFGTKVFNTFNDTETGIYGARDISSLGDLSPLYLRDIKFNGNAIKLTELIVGNRTEGYYNSNMESIQLDSCPLLRKLDATNCYGLGIDKSTGAQQPLDVSGCENIEEIYTLGTQISAVILPGSGFLKNLELPDTIRTLTLTNQLDLTEDKLIIGSYDNPRNLRNVTHLNVTNCPEIDGETLFRQCLALDSQALTNVRLDNIDWTGDNKITNWKTQLRKLYLPREDQFTTGVYSIQDNYIYFGETNTGIPSNALDEGYGYGLMGIDEKGDNVAQVTISGKCHIEGEMSGPDMKELIKYLPTLNITCDKLESTLHFFADDGITKVFTYTIISNTVDITCPDPRTLQGYPGDEAFARDSLIDTVYDLYGWSGNADNSQPRTNDPLVLQNITGDRNIYPAHQGRVRTYPMEFKYGETILHRIEEVAFGNSASYPKDKENLLVKYPEDLELSELYPFKCWYPEPVVNSDTLNYNEEDGSYSIMVECQVVFYEIDEQWEIPTIDEVDYTLHKPEANNLYITGRNNMWQDLPNVFVKIPETMTPDNVNHYTVKAISGLHNYPELQLVNFGNTLEKLITPEVSNGYDENGNPRIFGTFENDTGLIELTLPEQINYIGNFTFRNCTGLKSIKYNCRNLENTLSMQSMIFRYITDCEFEIGPSVEEIPSYLTHPYETGISSTIVRFNRIKFNTHLVNGRQVTNCKRVGAYSFTQAQMSELELAEGIEEIGERAFNTNNYITELKLPRTLNTLHNNAFARWKELETVELHDTLTKINGNPFVDCPKLKTIRIMNENGVEITNANLRVVNNTLYQIRHNEDNTTDYIIHVALEGGKAQGDVNVIGMEAFYGRTLQDSDIDFTKITNIKDSAFRETSGIENIEFNHCLKELAPTAFHHSTSIKRVKFHENCNLSQTGTYIFGSCDNLESVSLCDSIQQIANGAFNGCKNLTTISFTSGDNSQLEVIDVDTFTKCAISTLDLSKCNKLKRIKSNAFASCSNLDTILLPGSLELLEGGVFHKNTALKEIVLPDSLSTINNSTNFSNTFTGAFEDCSNLRTVYLGRGITEMPERTFWNCATKDEPLVLHTPLKEGELKLSATNWGANGITIIYDSPYQGDE